MISFVGDSQEGNGRKILGIALTIDEVLASIITNTQLTLDCTHHGFNIDLLIFVGPTDTDNADTLRGRFNVIAEHEVPNAAHNVNIFQKKGDGH